MRQTENQRLKENIRLQKRKEVITGYNFSIMMRAKKDFPINVDIKNGFYIIESKLNTMEL